MNAPELPDSVRAARSRMLEAKRRFTRAAMSALAGAPSATDQVSRALKEIDAARDELRNAEMTR